MKEGVVRTSSFGGRQATFGGKGVRLRSPMQKRKQWPVSSPHLIKQKGGSHGGGVNRGGRGKKKKNDDGFLGQRLLLGDFWRNKTSHLAKKEKREDEIGFWRGRVGNAKIGGKG